MDDLSRWASSQPLFLQVAIGVVLGLILLDLLKFIVVTAVEGAIVKYFKAKEQSEHPPVRVKLVLWAIAGNVLILALFLWFSAK